MEHLSPRTKCPGGFFFLCNMLAEWKSMFITPTPRRSKTDTSSGIGPDKQVPPRELHSAKMLPFCGSSPLVSFPRKREPRKTLAPDGSGDVLQHQGALDCCLRRNDTWSRSRGFAPLSAGLSRSEESVLGSFLPSGPSYPSPLAGDAWRPEPAGRGGGGNGRSGNTTSRAFWTHSAGP